MAQRSKPIDENEIIKSGTTDKIVQGFKEIHEQLVKNDEALKSIAKSASQIKPPTNSKEWASFNKALSEQETVYKTQHANQLNLLKVEQERERLKKLQLDTQAKEMRNQKQIEAGQKKELTAYQKLGRQLTEQRNAYKDLAARKAQGIKLTKEEEVQMRRLSGEVVRLDKTLKDIDGQVGQFQRNVGNYGSAWGGVGNAFKSLLPIMSGASIVSGIGGVLTGFENNLASFRTIVSDLSDNEFAKFEDKIKSVATTTKASSIEVAQSFENIAGLNAEFAETADGLGKISEAAITLSRASGDDLGQTTESLVGIMNQFSMAAEEADRTINVLAAGQAVGAAGITQLAESFKNVGSVAASSNVSLEQSVGLLEVLGKYNLMGAEAGTKLRGVILQLQKANMGYASGQFQINDALAEYNEKASKLTSEAEKNELAIKTFGAENITAGKILTNNIALINEYTEGVTDTTEAQKAASIQSQTLAAIWTELKNSLINIVTSSGQAGSAMNGLKTVLKFVSDNISTIISVLGKLITLWISYKAVMQSMKLMDYVKGLGSINNALKEQATNLKSATGAVDGFGRALKGIGIAAIITLVVELAKAWYDVGSGAKYARQEQEALELAMSKGAQRGENELARLRRLRDAQVKSAMDSGLSGGALGSAKSNADESYIKSIEDEIKRAEIALSGAMKRINKTSERGVVVGLGLGTDEAIEATANAEEIRQYIEKLRYELAALNKESFEQNLSDKLEDKSKDVGNAAKQIVDYRKQLRDLELETLEADDEITEEYLKNIAKISNKLKDEEERVKKESEDSKITQIEAEEYVNQLRINNARELAELRIKYEDDIYQYQREQELKALENQALELSGNAQLSKMTLGRTASQQRIAELVEYNDKRNAILDNQKITDEERNKQLEALEKSHGERMNKIEIEYLQKSIQYQLDHLQKTREIYGELSNESKEAEQRYLELEEQLQNALKRSAESIDKKSGLKDALSKIAGYFSNLMDTIMNKINQNIDLAIQSQNKLQQNSQNTIDILKQAAAAGNLQAKESILAEEREIEESQRRIEKLEKKRQMAQFITGVLGSYSAKVAAGDKNALTSSIAEATVLGAFLKTLPSFDVGTDRVDASGRGVDGKGGIPAIIHRNERIFTEDHNREIGFDLRNKEIVGIVKGYRNGFLVPKDQVYTVMTPQANQNDVILKEIRKGFESITHYDFSVNDIFSTVELIVTQKNKNNIVKHVKTIKK